MTETSSSPARLSREERVARVLDTAADLFYRRGVHEVGMDELVAASGLGKATVYRLYPTKADLVAAYLQRLADEIFAAIDARAAAHPDAPRLVLDGVFDAVARDVRRRGFRGCPFNNASIEFEDPTHPARVVARRYRSGLLARLTARAEQLHPGHGAELAARLALVIDGMYVNAAHLGARGPAAEGRALLDAVVSGDV